MFHFSSFHLRLHYFKISFRNYWTGEIQWKDLRRNSPMHRDKLGDDWMASKYSQKDLWVLMDTKLNVIQEMYP